jgi:chaperone modulatory protein CbpM
VSTEISEAVYLEDAGALSIAQLVERSGLSEDELRALVECDALSPRDLSAPSWTFSAHCIVVARTAFRLRRDFALDDAHSLAVVLRFAQRIEMLESELRAVRARRGR